MGWNYLSTPKLQRLHHWSLGMDMQFHPTFYNGCNCLFMPGLKLKHVDERGHWSLYLHREIIRLPLSQFMVNQQGKMWLNRWHAIAKNYTVTKQSKEPQNCTHHYGDVIMGAMAPQITNVSSVYQQFVQAKIKENIKALRHWPLWGEFPGDRWIPRTKGQ